MNFEDFTNIVSKIEKNPLPGKVSHFKMAHQQRLKALNTPPVVMEKAKQAAVLAAFYPDQHQQTQLLFIKRASGGGVHANQVAFPGGKKEPSDTHFLYTAFREAHEEVGIRSKDISFVKPLTPLYIPPSNFMVHPFLALYHKRVPFVKQDSEVLALLEVPLSDLFNSNNKSFSKITAAYTKDLQVPSFKFKDQIVWGATAMILNEIRLLLKEVL